MILRRIILGCLALFLAGCGIDDPVESGEDPVKAGDAVPIFSVTLQDGSIFNSREPSGMVSVIVFFHTSCPDCQQLLPEVQRLYVDSSPVDVRFVCIARAQRAQEIKAFWLQKQLTLPWSAQEDRSVYSLFAASRIPRVYIVDRAGKVRFIFDDNPVPSRETLSAALHSVLGE